MVSSSRPERAIPLRREERQRRAVILEIALVACLVLGQLPNLGLQAARSLGKMLDVGDRLSALLGSGIAGDRDRRLLDEILLDLLELQTLGLQLIGGVRETRLERVQVLAAL